jgi:hypothetical protein
MAPNEVKPGKQIEADEVKKKQRCKAVSLVTYVLPQSLRGISLKYEKIIWNRKRQENREDDPVVFCS